jgi:hypothetical protein
MSYVQGTKVRVTGRFRDPDTNELEDPDDVVVTIWPPDLPTEVRRLSDAEVDKIGDGIYQTVIDTAPVAGTWIYIFEGTGTEAIAVRRELRVRPRPAIVP